MGREEGGTERIRRGGRVPTLTLSSLYTHREGLVLSFGESCALVMCVVDECPTARRSFSRDGRYVACIYTTKIRYPHGYADRICSPCFRSNHTLACNSVVLSHSLCSDHSYRMYVLHTRSLFRAREVSCRHLLHSTNYCTTYCLPRVS